MGNSFIVSRKQIESGDFSLLGKTATKVTGDVVDHINGISTPVYVVSEKEVADGEFKVSAGRPVRVIATRSSQKIQGKKATPVYAVGGTLAGAAWIPEDGMPNGFKMPVARFDFMKSGVNIGAIVTRVAGTYGNTLQQNYALQCPWMSHYGMMTRNGWLDVPENLVGKIAAIDFNGHAEFDLLEERFGLYMPPIREIIVYDELNTSEMMTLAQYVQNK